MGDLEAHLMSYLNFVTINYRILVKLGLNESQVNVIKYRMYGPPLWSQILIPAKATSMIFNHLMQKVNLLVGLDMES